MEFFSLIKYSFAPLIVVLSLVGSTFGLIVFSRPSLLKIGPRNIYRFMFAFEFMNVIILLEYIRNNFGLNVSVLSTYSCKSIFMMFLVYEQIPPMLLVYISIERFVSIAYPFKRFFLRRNSTQSIYFVGLIVYNCCLYSFILFFGNLTFIMKIGVSNETIKITDCIVDKNAYMALNNIDLINRVAVPFLLMFITTILLIRQIYRSRKKFSSKINSNSKQRKLNKDVRISVSIMLMNLSFLSLCLPISFSFLFFNSVLKNNLSLSTILQEINFLNYSLDFYIIIATNFLVRQEFFKIFHKS